MVKTDPTLNTAQLSEALAASGITPLEVLNYPHVKLETECEPVGAITEEIKLFIKNMFITMYARNGVGLAANQVGELKRIFIIDTSNSGDKRKVYINPEIITSAETQRWKEGCLSFPGIFAYVKRAAKITIKALDEDGNEFQQDLQGLDAICFQHELDHLNGIVFYNHLSPLQRNMLRKKMKPLLK